MTDENVDSKKNRLSSVVDPEKIVRDQLSTILAVALGFLARAFLHPLALLLSFRTHVTICFIAFLIAAGLSGYAYLRRRTLLGKPLRQRRLTWLIFGVAVVSLITGIASIYLKFFVVLSSSEQSGIKILIATEHQLRGEKSQEPFHAYFELNARIVQNSPDPECQIWQGFGGNPGVSGTILDAYTKQTNNVFLHAHYRKRFLPGIEPQLSADKKTAVMISQTQYRDPGTTDWKDGKTEFWIFSQSQTGYWRIAEIQGGLDLLDAESRYQKVIHGS